MRKFQTNKRTDGEHHREHHEEKKAVVKPSGTAKIEYSTSFMLQNPPPQVALGSTGITCLQKVRNAGDGIGSFKLKCVVTAPNGTPAPTMTPAEATMAIGAKEVLTVPYPVRFADSGLSRDKLVGRWLFLFRLTPLGKLPIDVTKWCTVQ